MAENIEESPYKRSGDDQNHGQGKRGVSVLDVLRKAVDDSLFSFFGILALKMPVAECQPEDYHKNQGRQGRRNDMLKIKQIKVSHTISLSRLTAFQKCKKQHGGTDRQSGKRQEHESVGFVTAEFFSHHHRWFILIRFIL